MEKITTYIDQNFDKFVDELFQYLRIPSVSSVSGHKDDMLKAAEKLRDILLNSGAEKAMVLPTQGNPVVYAEKILNVNLPTVLVYGHYDVMPVDPVHLWHSSPFEPIIKDEKIYARGADDDKGQSFIQIKAFETLVKTNSLPCNIKFLVEGEEEIGSPNLKAFCEDNHKLLHADVILVSDTSLLDKDVPSITTGLRGLSYLQVELTGPDKDLHSGLFGGAVANPAIELSKMLASLINPDGQINIPGFYDDVENVSQEERNELNRAPFSVEKYKEALNIKEVDGEKGYTTIERVGIRPSFDINGMWSGYTGEGAKTVLPSKAYAKISFRLVPNQNNKKISEIVKNHLISICPPNMKIDVKALHGGQGYVSSVNTKAYLAASKAMEATFGKKPVPYRSGGSIPIISTFEEVLGIKTILMGFGLESDAIHSPNENFPLENLKIGINTVCRFYKYFSEE